MRRVRPGTVILVHGVVALGTGLGLILLTVAGYNLLSGPESSLFQVGLGIFILVIGLLLLLVGKAVLSDPALQNAVHFGSSN